MTCMAGGCGINSEVVGPMGAAYRKGPGMARVRKSVTAGELADLVGQLYVLCDSMQQQPGALPVVWSLESRLHSLLGFDYDITRDTDAVADARGVAREEFTRRAMATMDALRGQAVSDLIAAGQRWRAYFDEVPPQMRQARADWVAPLGFVYCASCVASDVVPRQLLDPVTARVVPWDVMGDPRRFAFVCDGCAAAGENGGQA